MLDSKENLWTYLSLPIDLSSVKLIFVLCTRIGTRASAIPLQYDVEFRRTVPEIAVNEDSH